MKKRQERNNDIYEIIVKNIKEERKNAKLTQAELAEKSNYSHEFIRRIEAPNGKKYFSINTLVRLADALDIEESNVLRAVNEDGISVYSWRKVSAIRIFRV